MPAIDFLHVTLRRSLLVLAGALAAAHAVAGDSPPATPAAAVQAAAPPATAPQVPQVSQDALIARQQQHDASLFLLDVRSPDEFAAGHVPGAVNIPHDQVASRLAEVPKDKDVVLYCRSGHRSGLAAGVLAGNGYTRISHLAGDMDGWKAQGRPIETGAATASTPKP